MTYPRTNTDDWIFRETFDSVSSVIENGGDIISVPTINKGATLDGTDDAIRYTDRFENIKSVVFTIQVTTTTEDILDLDGGTHTVEVSTGTLTATGFSSPTIYVDGSVSSTLSTAEHQVVITTATGFQVDSLDIGSVGASFGQFIIKEVRVYNRALSADEVSDIYNEVTFSEIDDSKALVSLPLRSYYGVTTENIGSLGGTVQLGDGSTSTTYPTQLTPHGMSFDGGDYLQASTALVPATDWFTVVMLVKYESLTGAAQGLFGQYYDEVTERFALAATNTNISIQIGGTNIAHSVTNQNGSIHQLAFTRQSGDMFCIYLDGVCVKEQSNSTRIDQQASTIGAYFQGGASAYWKGDIYTCRIYNFALTPTQIKYLYNKDMRLLNK